MIRRVQLTRDAEEDLNSAADWWAKHRSAEQADRWYLGIRRAIRLLIRTAAQCSTAAESVKTGVPLQQMLFGLGKKPSHRVIFIQDADEIVVLRIRHVAQRPLTIDDLPS